MKKLSLVALLGTSLILVGCGPQSTTPTNPNENTNTTPQTGVFAAAVCDEYFRVLECTLASQVPADQQADIQTVIDQTKEARKALDASQQESTCQAAWDNEIVPQAELYNSFGCNVNVPNVPVDTVTTGTTTVSSIDPSRDVDGDGINDCEKEWICDDTVDYSQPRMNGEETITGNIPAGAVN